MYYFRIPIGDWSNDGHGKRKDFITASDRPIDQAREAHFKIKELTGIDIESICSEYEDSSITVDLLNELSLYGVNPEMFDLPYKGEVGITEEGMAHIWVSLLNFADPELNIVLLEDLPMLPFYGFDEKKRHIGHVGYGCFS